ncbi:MAG: hypothetical protein BWY20_02164 [Spirochaetes bacterium ADurb.Bin215]|nr:MAG: hypothetical protein BWY20_02164 [Spirochaetes bacterium ADurb.Bin215]
MEGRVAILVAGVNVRAGFDQEVDYIGFCVRKNRDVQCRTSLGITGLDIVCRDDGLDRFRALPDRPDKRGCIFHVFRVNIGAKINQKGRLRKMVPFYCEGKRRNSFFVPFIRISAR